jgi:glycosyltransferase involved in cell wall biosynthesis
MHPASGPAAAAAMARRSIGVVVALYDDYHYLGECLAHLVRGSRRHPLHVCLCIDESRYDTAAREVVAGLVDHYKLAPEIVFNNRGGPAVARNGGIRRLLDTQPGLDYFFFMDADNFVGDGDLDTLVDCLERAPDDVVYTYQNIIKFGEVNQYIRLDVPFDRWRLLNVFYGETGNLVRARVCREGQLFHEGELLARNTGEDVEFFRRLGGHYRGIFCPGTRFHYRTKLLHRDSVYWPKHDILSAWMKQANERLYADAEAEFFATRCFDVAGIAAGRIDDLTAVYHADAARTQRSLLELGRGMLLGFAAPAGFAELQASPLHGLVVGDLCRDPGKRARLYRFHATGDEDSFRYARRTARLGDLGAESGFGFMALPAASCPDFPACRDWNPLGMEIDVVDIWGLCVPRLAALSGADVQAFFANWQRFERGRELLPQPAGSGEVYKFPNHGDWLADQLRDDWRYLASQRERLLPSGPKRAPRICVVAAVVMVGGSDVATIELLRSLRREFPDACIDVLFAHFVWSESGSNQGNNFRRLDWISSCVDGIFFADLVQPHLRPAFLRRLLSSYDLLHIETSLPAYWQLKEIREEGRRPKIVCHLYCWDYYLGLRVGFPVFAPKYADVVDVFSCQTRLVADFLSTRNVPRRKIFWLPYASRLPQASAPKPAADRLRLLWIGRWVEQKNPALLVRAMEMLLERDARLHFSVLVIGNFDNERHFDRGELRKLQAFAKRFPDQVAILAGPVAEPELARLYLASDILLSTSTWEGIPFTFYEAMACACVPLATDVGANRELVVDGVNGILVPPGDAQAIANAIRRLGEDPARLQALREGIAATSGANEADAFAHRHMDIFKRLLAGESPSGYYRDYTPERGHATADAELNELAALAARLQVGLGPEPDWSAISDPLLGLHEKQAEIRRRTALLLERLGLLPSVLDPTAQIRREGPGVADKAAGFIAQMLERTGLFAPHWLPTLEDAHRSLRHSRGVRGLALGAVKFAHAAGRRWLARRQALRRLRQSQGESGK